jgi:hypothetical protein
MKRGMLKLSLALALLGLAAPAQAQTFYHYQCTDGGAFELAFYPETKAAYLQIDGKSVMLPKRFSLISQRFKKDGISLAMRSGGKAVVKHFGKTSQCQVKTEPQQ